MIVSIIRTPAREKKNININVTFWFGHNFGSGKTTLLQYILSTVYNYWEYTVQP